MIVEHVRVYVSPMDEVKITKDRAGWPEVADAVIRMHRARIQQKKAEAGRTYSRMVKAGLLMMDDRELADMEMFYTAYDRNLVKKLCRIRKKMRQGYCPYNRERYRLEVRQ